MNKVLFIDSVHPFLNDELQKNGFICEHHYDLGYSDYLNMVDQYIGIIVRSGIKLDQKILSHAHKLKFIGRVGAGLENIDTDYTEANNILCFNAAEGNRDAVGEHTLSLLLCLFTKMLTADKEVRMGEWNREQNRGLEITDKTIAIIGYGNMGSAFAQRLQGFNCRVIAYDKYKSGFSSPLVEEVEMTEVFKSADVLSFHVPYTEETHYLLNKEYISLFKKNFWLLNTARGKVVNTKDLVDGLKSGKILGAGLDVLEYESVSFEAIKNIPKPLEYLQQVENVVLSPHIAGWTKESNLKLAQVIANKIISVKDKIC